MVDWQSRGNGAISTELVMSAVRPTLGSVILTLPSLAQYPYLDMDLMLLAVLLVALAVAPAERRRILTSGLLSLPFGLWSAAHVPDYWSPKFLARFRLAGLEDLLYAFLAGALAWWLATALSQRRMAAHANFFHAAWRYALFSGVGTAVCLPLWLGGVDVMTAVLIGLATMGALLAMALPSDERRLAATGSVGFCLLYGVVLKTTTLLWPQFLDQWHAPNLSGVKVLAMPVEELAWALAFGAVWPLAILFVLDGRTTSVRAATADIAGGERVEFAPQAPTAS